MILIISMFVFGVLLIVVGLVWDHKLHKGGGSAGIILLLAICANSQTPTPTPDTGVIKTLREVIAERNFFQSQSIEYKRQAEANKRNAAEWERLYEAEKDRADRVQGGQVDELRTANAELKAENAELRKANGDLFKSNAKYEAQSTRDAEQLKSYERKIASLKTQRWIFAGLGAAGGAYLGYKFGTKKETTTIVTAPGPPPRPSFGFSLNF